MISDSGGSYEVISQTVTDFDAGETHTFSVYVLKDIYPRTTRFPMLRLVSWESGVESLIGYIKFDTKTGEYVLSGDAIFGGVENYNMHWRVWVTVRSRTTYDELIPTLYPAYGKGTDSSADLTATGFVFIWGFQVNEGETPAPHISTTDTLSPELGQKIDLDIAESVKDKRTIIKSSHRTRGNEESLYTYLWGTYGKIDIKLEYLSTAKKTVINSWWENNTHLVYSDAQNAANYNVLIGGKSKPIDAVNKPYTNQFKGTLTLEGIT